MRSRAEPWRRALLTSDRMTGAPHLAASCGDVAIAQDDLVMLNLSTSNVRRSPSALPWTATHTGHHALRQRPLAALLPNTRKSRVWAVCFPPVSLFVPPLPGVVPLSHNHFAQKAGKSRSMKQELESN
jgi:hypothetical protein